MKPLFQFEEKEQRTLIKDYIGEFEHINYDFQILESNDIAAGEMIKIFPKNNEESSILAIPWVRPASSKNSEVIKNLHDYPRLNLPKDIKMLPEEKRVREMMKRIHKKNIYFLVVLPRVIFEDLFWFAPYSSIPEKYWELTYRKTPDNKDRIILSRYDKYKFIKLFDLKLELDKLCKNENQ